MAKEDYSVVEVSDKFRRAIVKPSAAKPVPTPSEVAAADVLRKDRKLNRTTAKRRKVLKEKRPSRRKRGSSYAWRDGDSIFVRLKILDELRESSSGKSFVVASLGGKVYSDENDPYAKPIQIEGIDVRVVANAFVVVNPSDPATYKKKKALKPPKDSAAAAAE